MRVIAFTGLPASGKSAAVEVARERGIPVFRMGDLVLEEVQRRGLSLGEEHIGPIASGMRAQDGDDVWARRTTTRLQEATQGAPLPPLVVIDGVRSRAEIEHFRAAYGDDFTLVAIEAPPHVRHARLRQRGRTDDAAELAVIQARDEREKGWGIEAAIASAEHRIENLGELDELRRKVADLLARLAG